MKAFHVYDLDGTLIDSSHRYRTLKNGDIDLPAWRKLATPRNILRDKLLPLAGQFRADIRNPETFVVIATARVMTPADFIFVQNKLGNPDHFISRNGEKDNRPDAMLKLDAIRPMLNLRQFQNIKRRIWEDNQTIIKAFKALGFQCYDMKKIYLAK